MARMSRGEELAAIEQYIAEYGVEKSEPFDEQQARRKWRLASGTITVNGDGRRKPEESK